MANYAYVKLRKNQKPFDLPALAIHLRKTLKKLFPGLVKVTRYRPGNAIEIVAKRSQCYAEGRLHIWSESPHELSIPHRLFGEFGWWVDTVTVNEIAVVTGGRISDDGVSGSWKGKPGKYHRLEDYLTAMHNWKWQAAAQHGKQAWNDAQFAGLLDDIVDQYPEVYRADVRRLLTELRAKIWPGRT